MDNYIEQIVKKKPDAKQRLMLVGAVLVIMLGVASILFYDMSVGIMIAAAGGFLIYFAKNQQDQEYEYVFVNADCDIARISNKQNRKEVYSFKGGDVQKVLQYTSQQFDNELQANGNLIIKDFTSGDKSMQDNWYMFITNANGKTVAVGLELNEKTITYVETYYKNKHSITGVNTSYNK